MEASCQLCIISKIMFLMSALSRGFTELIKDPVNAYNTVALYFLLEPLITVFLVGYKKPLLG